jgi:hypothetical protein
MSKFPTPYQAGTLDTGNVCQHAGSPKMGRAFPPLEVGQRDRQDFSCPPGTNFNPCESEGNNLTKGGMIMDDESIGTILGSQNCKREKYWDELTDAEKIGRMRSEVKQLQRTVYRQANLIDQLLIHSHGDNSLFVPLDAYGRNIPEPSRGIDRDVYF